LTEEFDEQGKLKSVSTTETKTTLVDVGVRGYTLKLEVTVEVAGKRIVAQPRTVRLGYYGETDGQRVVVNGKGEGDLLLGGRKFRCRILEAAINGGDEKVVSRIHYCGSTAPFVLKRETKSTDLEGETVHLHTQEDVVAFEMPHRVVAEIKTVAHVRAVKKHAKGSTYTLEVRCEEVPGGVVSLASKELDATGRLVRRSTSELLDYQVINDNKKGKILPRLFHRSRPVKGSVRVAPSR
jgi:hypothetical protein